MIAIVLALLLAATPEPMLSPEPVATPVASPVASPDALPQETATPAAAPEGTASPSASATPSAPPPLPEPTINYGYRFVPHQPAHLAAGQPQIFAVYLNSNKLKSLGPIDIKVSTSPDVERVFTRSNGHDGDIPMIAAGDFEAIGKLPKLPFIASGVSTIIEFVAVGQSGKRVTVPVPVLLK